ncbi:hypothetical protein [Halorientalis sp.]|uniref:hypothetical protein n=1 Tax=Halorientalis sp. TaxID=1931229 RepID=UPI002639DD0E|nr:hypothetical protein [Halorientalis sp.]
MVTPNISTAPPTTDDLRALVQEYWERQFRVGVQDLGLPHTREFTEEVQRLAEVWDWKWTVTCQLCDRSLNQLNLAYLGYHHWQYEPDVGTSLCQFCHDFLHGGDESDQASQQDWRAKKLGLRDFRDLAVIRLALRDREVHDFDIPEDDPAYARRLRTRYNVPLSVDRIVTLVSEVQHDNAVQEVIRDHGSSPTVPDHNIHPV